MRIASAALLALDVPFVEQFAHAAKTRRASDALVLKITTEDGTVGWGETLVRPYLSGETVASTLASMRELVPRLVKESWHLDFTAPTPRARLAPVTLALDALLETLPLQASVRAYTGIRCALELAILDALLRRAGRELADIMAPARNEVIYSGVISAEEPAKSLKIARQLKQLGIQHYKLKVAPGTALDLVRDIRALIGGASLRLDANASFAFEEAVAFCQAIESSAIDAIEEPLKDATPQTLGALQTKTSIPIMVDEALVTPGDADELIEVGAAKMLNIRLAKCGGVAPCLALVEKAAEAGVGLQLGALVGETAILSTVGRWFACAVERIKFVEGSYGTLLLKEDIGRRSVRFGHGGRAPALRGPGLGVEVDEAVVRKYVVADSEP